MASSRKNRTLFIDLEAVSALALLKAGLLYPVTKLQGSAEAKEVVETGMIDGKTFPFPFLLAPAGKMNEEVLRTAEVGETLELLTVGDQVVGSLTVDEVFPIDTKSYNFV